MTSVLITDIPRELRDPKHLEKAFEAFPDSVRTVRLNLDLSSVARKLERLDRHVDDLEVAYTKQLREFQSSGAAASGDEKQSRALGGATRSRRCKLLPFLTSRSSIDRALNPIAKISEDVREPQKNFQNPKPGSILCDRMLSYPIRGECGLPDHDTPRSLLRGPPPDQQFRCGLVEAAVTLLVDSIPTGSHGGRRLWLPPQLLVGTGCPHGLAFTDHSVCAQHARASLAGHGAGVGIEYHSRCVATGHPHDPHHLFPEVLRC